MLIVSASSGWIMLLKFLHSFVFYELKLYDGHSVLWTRWIMCYKGITHAALPTDRQGLERHTACLVKRVISEGLFHVLSSMCSMSWGPQMRCWIYPSPVLSLKFIMTVYAILEKLTLLKNYLKWRATMEKMFSLMKKRQICSIILTGIVPTHTLLQPLPRKLVRLLPRRPMKAS